MSKDIRIFIHIVILIHIFMQFIYLYMFENFVQFTDFAYGSISNWKLPLFIWIHFIRIISITVITMSIAFSHFLFMIVFSPSSITIHASTIFIIWIMIIFIFILSRIGIDWVANNMKPINGKLNCQNLCTKITFNKYLLQEKWWSYKIFWKKSLLYLNNNLPAPSDFANLSLPIIRAHFHTLISIISRITRKKYLAT